MIRRATIAALAAASLTIATLAVYTAPSLAHVGYIPIAKFGSTGLGPGQFNTPVGVATDETSEDVYVVDQGNKRIEKFDADGKYLSQIDGNETPAKTFVNPTYIAVDNSGDSAKGHIYIVDTGQNPTEAVVNTFDSSGKYLFQITPEYVRAITTDTSGHLWVSKDGLMSGFEEYSETGTLIMRHSTPGAGPGVTVDSSGNIYVLYPAGDIVRYSPPGFPEDNESSIKTGQALAINPATDNVFQDSGSSVIEWPPFGEGPRLWERTEETFSGGLKNSNGLAVNGKSGKLYASDDSGNDIEAFEIGITPEVGTGAASKVTVSSVTIEGTVNPEKAKTEYRFEWGETESYGNSTTLEEAGEGGVSVPVSADIIGLEPNTVYHYRIVANNEKAAARGVDKTFTTLPVLPIVEGGSTASDATRSSVLLHAAINPKHSSTTYHFVYAEEAVYDATANNPYGAGGTTAFSEAGANTGGRPVEQLLVGLKPNTTYHYMVVAINQAGRVTGTDATFTTGAATPPTVVAGGASGVTQNNATVGATVNTSGLPTTYGFEIGTSSDYGPPTGLGSAGAGASEAVVTLSLSGLQPGTTYHYRLTATNVDGTSYGADETFTTTTFASTFAEPPAPLPFVTVPSIAFPTEAKPVVKKKTKAKKKVKKRGKAKGKKKAKHKKKK